MRDLEFLHTSYMPLVCNWVTSSVQCTIYVVLEKYIK